MKGSFGFGGRPRDKFGARHTRDVWPDLCENSNSRGRNVRGTDGTYTDGTHIRGCPAKILYVYWFFFFPHKTKLYCQNVMIIGVFGMSYVGQPASLT